MSGAVWETSGNRRSSRSGKLGLRSWRGPPPVASVRGQSTSALEERSFEESSFYPEEPIRGLRPKLVSFPREMQSYAVAQRSTSTGAEKRGNRAFACLIGRVLSQSDAVKLAPETHQSVLARNNLLPQASLSMRKCPDLLLHRASRCVRTRGNVCSANQTGAGSDAPSGGAHLILAR
jgi:hypothetical protein